MTALASSLEMEKETCNLGSIVFFGGVLKFGRHLSELQAFVVKEADVAFAPALLVKGEDIMIQVVGDLYEPAGRVSNEGKLGRRQRPIVPDRKAKRSVFCVDLVAHKVVQRFYVFEQWSRSWVRSV